MTLKRSQCKSSASLFLPNIAVLYVYLKKCRMRNSHTIGCASKSHGEHTSASKREKIDFKLR